MNLFIMPKHSYIISKKLPMKDPFAEHKQYSGNYSECEMSLQTDNFFWGSNWTVGEKLLVCEYQTLCKCMPTLFKEEWTFYNG